MRIKRYVAPTMEQALQEVKAELGPGAIILEARRRRPALGLFGRGGFEVIAAVDPGLRVVSDLGSAGDGPALAPAAAEPKRRPVEPPAAPRPAAVRAYHRASRAQAAEAEGMEGGDEAPPTAPAAGEARPWWMEEFRGTAPAGVVNRVQAAAAPVPAEPAPALPQTADLAALLRCDLMPQTAERLLAGGVGINDPEFARRLEELAAERLGPGHAGPVRTVAFVGPTGSGKTTTLAKLASRAVLLEGRSVALITLDTYRIGAVDQLQTYAEILDVPLYVAYTADDLLQAVERCRSADLVLIDTAGRGPGDAVAIARLRRVLDQVQIDEIHLVMAAGTRVLDAQYLGATYRRLGPNRLLLTKLDETLGLGGILELPAVMGLPVSYFTFGQSVPDDIEPATPQRAAVRIMDALRAAREEVLP
ncbi:MAG: flagellar biosynthesis protein FlhF [Thermaerobacter sp.]